MEHLEREKANFCKKKGNGEVKLKEKEGHFKKKGGEIVEAEIR